MTKLYAFILGFLKCPVALFGLIAFVSIFSLAAAFIAEGYFGLEPCIMCIYQRYPFAIGFVLGLAGLAKRKSTKAVQIFLGLCGVNFLINSAMAFYHTGIEQKWWISAVEGCTTPKIGVTSGQTLLENIMSAPTARCDVIPWQDPILGLSMANYNILLCFGLFAMCILAIFVRRKNKEA